jgi:hypothetical protein
MPSIKRLPAPRRGDGGNGELCQWKDFECVFGLRSAGPWLGFRGLDIQEMGEYWDYHADRLVSEWAERFPGHRPNGWWAFDPAAAELPEIPIDNRHDFDRYEAKLRETHTLINGRLLLWGYYHDIPAFLDSHGILTPSERRRIELDAEEDELSIDPRR